MKKIVTAIILCTLMLTCGCVERELTITTNPSESLVELNDEQIGYSPVTVGFEWYGDYNIKISKQGYETLKTHRELERPTHDYFPFDFFAQVLNPKKITDKHELHFDLEPKKPIDRELLLDDAKRLEQKLK